MNVYTNHFSLKIDGYRSHWTNQHKHKIIILDCWKLFSNKPHIRTLKIGLQVVVMMVMVINEIALLMADAFCSGTESKPLSKKKTLAQKRTIKNQNIILSSGMS